LSTNDLPANVNGSDRTGTVVDVELVVVELVVVELVVAVDVLEVVDDDVVDEDAIEVGIDVMVVASTAPADLAKPSGPAVPGATSVVVDSRSGTPVMVTVTADCPTAVTRTLAAGSSASFDADDSGFDASHTVDAPPMTTTPSPTPMVRRARAKRVVNREIITGPTPSRVLCHHGTSTVRPAND
jgi:hypothetical protein